MPQRRAEPFPPAPRASPRGYPAAQVPWEGMQQGEGAGQRPTAGHGSPGMGRDPCLCNAHPFEPHQEFGPSYKQLLSDCSIALLSLTRREGSTEDIKMSSLYLLKRSRIYGSVCSLGAKSLVAARAPRRAKAPRSWLRSSLKVQPALHHLKHSHRYLCSSGFPDPLTQRKKETQPPRQTGSTASAPGSRTLLPSTRAQHHARHKSKASPASLLLTHQVRVMGTAVLGAGAARGTPQRTHRAGTAAAECTQAPSQKLGRPRPPTPYSPAE